MSTTRPMANDPAVLHALFRLADYPLLTSLARGRTEATRLDGRACLAIYEAALARIDWQAVSESERGFMQRLGVEVNR